MKLIDLTGKRFGRLTVIERGEDYILRTGQRTPRWVCVCDCGKVTLVRGTHLKSGSSTSCGCLREERAIQSLTTHNHRHHRLYGVLCNIKNRCYNENVKCFKNYGGRGISMCEEWRNNFESFFNWAMSSGYDPDAPFMQCTIDRIDVDGNYEPDNCRWVDAKTQNNNTRRHRDKAKEAN